MNKKNFTKRLRHLCLLCLMLLLGSGNVWGEEVLVTYDFSKVDNYPSGFPTKNGTALSSETEFIFADSLKFSLLNANSGNYYIINSTTTNTALFFGKNVKNFTSMSGTCYLKFPGRSGYKITKIVITNGSTCAEKISTNIFNSSATEVSTAVSTAHSTDMTFVISSVDAGEACYFTCSKTQAAGKNLQISKAIVTYTTSTGAETAASPTLTTSTTFTTSTYDVTITNNESGATVYYTTDGSDPTTSTETSFTGESKTIQISATTTVKAMAVLTGKDNSSIASATYTYEKPIANTQETAYTIAKAKEIIDGGSSQLTTTRVYVTGYVSQIDTLYSTSGKMNYWLSDTKSTAADFEVYNGLNADSTKFTAKTDLVVGDSVTIYGFIKKYGTTYEFSSNNILKFRKTSATQKTPTITATYKTSLTYPGSADVYTIETNSDGALTVLSSNTSVAGAEYSGKTVTITPFSVGTTTITICFNATENYYAAEKTYTLTVTEPYSRDNYKAVVSKYNGKYYAMTNNVSGGKANAVVVYSVNNKVLTTDVDPDTISWQLTTDNYVKSASGKFVSFSSSTMSLINSSTKTFSDSIDENGSYWISDSRGFIYRGEAGGFKTYATSNAGTSGYGTLGSVMTFTDGYTRIVTKDNWGTICLPNAVEVADMYGAKFYSISGMTGTTANPTSLVLTEETGALVAGRPYFFKATADTLVVAYTGEAAKISGNHNGLFGSIYGGVTVEQGHYILKNNTLLKVDNTFTCGANRAYVSFTSVPTTSAKGDVVIAVDGATGIESLSPTSTSSTTNEEAYNLQGQKVGAGYKGVVIKNGKKLLVK